MIKKYDSLLLLFMQVQHTSTHHLTHSNENGTSMLCELSFVSNMEICWLPNKAYLRCRTPGLWEVPRFGCDKIRGISSELIVTYTVLKIKHIVT